MTFTTKDGIDNMVGIFLFEAIEALLHNYFMIAFYTVGIDVGI